MFSLVFFSTSSHQLPPRAHRPHGLKAEAIAIEKWGIATDRLKKNPNPRPGFLVAAHLALGSLIPLVYLIVL